MQIHELEAFVRAYESGSFTAAAQAGYITRQAQSKTIANLEAEIGPLFARQARGIKPTPLACAIYPRSQRILAEYAAITAEAQRRREGLLGAITLVCDPGAMVTFPPNALAQYRTARPGIELTCKLEHEATAAQMLEAHKVDAVISCPIAVVGSAFAPVQCSKLAVVFSRNAFTEAELATLQNEDGGNTTPLETLNDKVLFGISPDNFVERMVLPYLQSHGISPHIVYDLTDTAIMRNEMEVGLGGVFVEWRTIEQNFSGPDYVVVPFPGADAPLWQTGVTYFPEGEAAALALDFASFLRNLIV